jgi:hypothetical protein
MFIKRNYALSQRETCPEKENTIGLKLRKHRKRMTDEDLINLAYIVEGQAERWKMQ